MFSYLAFLENVTSVPGGLRAPRSTVISGAWTLSSEDWQPIKISGYAGSLIFVKPPKTGVTTSQPIDPLDDLLS